MALTTRDQVRLRIGDTDAADPLLSDDEVDDLITAHTTVTTAGTAVDVPGAASSAAAAIAAKFARGYNFSTDGQSFNRAERVAHYQQLAARLAAQSVTAAGGGASTVPVKSSVSAAANDDIAFTS